MKRKTRKKTQQKYPTQPSPRGKRCPSKLVSSQGSLPPSSGAMHPDQEEVRQKHQEAYTDE